MNIQEEIDLEKFDPEVREIVLRAWQLNSGQLSQLQAAIEAGLETVAYRNWVSRVDAVIEVTHPMTHVDLGGCDFDLWGRWSAGQTPQQVAHLLIQAYDNLPDVGF